MVVPLGPAATAPTLTAAFVIAHSSATPIGTRSPNPPSRCRDRTAIALAARLLLRPSVRRRTGDRLASGDGRGRREFSVRFPIPRKFPAVVLPDGGSWNAGTEGT